MESMLPEKARLLENLKKGGFNVPDFIYIPASAFHNEDFKAVQAFLGDYAESFKVIARSAHPEEQFFKGGTFDSLETYADLGGIKYARNHMIRSARSSRRLSILRQQKFNNAPEIDLDDMGVIVMPFIEGTSVMAKMVGDHWEFGYCRDSTHKFQSDPYITETPRDRKLLEVSQTIQQHLGFRCEIEYIVSREGEINVVQAKDISHVEILEQAESTRSIRLDGVRRIRKRRNYRERPVYVMDNKTLYLDIITKCEDIVHGWNGLKPGIQDVLDIIVAYEQELEDFALRHQRFAVLGLCIKAPEELYQVANHYLDDTPEQQRQLSRALSYNLYKTDCFLAEADTIITKDKIRIDLCSHDAYGIDTIRNPMWSIYWNVDRHDRIVKDFIRLGFKTGESIGIDINPEGKPTIYRL